MCEDAPVDDLESWFDKGVTDGLPVVPPSRARVERMLAASARAREDLVGEVPPNYGRATVEKVATNAVMAGCRPEYMPVLIALIEAMCDPQYGVEHSGNTPGGDTLIILTGLTMSPTVDTAFPWLLTLFGGRQAARTSRSAMAPLAPEKSQTAACPSRVSAFDKPPDALTPAR